MGQYLSNVVPMLLIIFRPTNITGLQAYIDKQSIEDIKIYSCYKLNRVSTNLLLCILALKNSSKTKMSNETTCHHNINKIGLC